jgi:hypothetical protein
MMARQIRTEPVVHTLPDGRRALYLLPVIPDDAPDPIREGIARRRVAALTGDCPCGAHNATLSRQQRRARQRRTSKRQANPAAFAFEHEYDCPAGDQRLIPMLQAWIAGDDLQECA